MEALHALALGLSFLAVVVAAGCWFRGTPALIRRACDDALTARRIADAALESQASFKIECGKILDAVSDEREEASRLRARASAAASRAARTAENTEPEPEDRGAQMIRLRQVAGIT